MSILSNHFPELLEQINPGEPVCCQPEIDGRLCPLCALDYENWARTLPEWYGEIVDILPEPSGQQFPEEPPV